MAQCGQNGLQVLRGSLFTAGQVDDQGSAAGAGHAAGQAGPGRDLKAGIAHRFRDPPRLALRHREGRLRRHIPRRQPRPPGGQHQRHIALITAGFQLRRDPVKFIRDNTGIFHLIARLLQLCFQRRAGGVLPLAAAALVADGDNSSFIFHEKAHSFRSNVPDFPPVFFSSRIRSMTISRWTALHRS